MLELRVYGGSASLAKLGAELEARGSARHATLVDAVCDGNAVLTAELDSRAADAALEFVLDRGIRTSDVAITRVDDVGPIGAPNGAASLIWTDVIGRATDNARPVARAATVGVALAAGVAGMLALETRAGAAVGVAISVTTIPAAAYLGVAAGVGERDKAASAVAVLAVNVAMLVAGGTSTLVVQRLLASRARPRTAPAVRER